VSLESEDDRELLRRIAAGDRAAFGGLFDRHAAAALRYALRMVRDRAAAEDAVNGAFARLIESAAGGGIDPAKGTLRGLLFRTVRNLSIDWLRARRREAALEDLPDGTAARAKGLRLDIEAALARLSEQHRSALLLRVDAGLSYAEIAAALGATVGQVRMWIFKARRALAESMLGPSPSHGGRPCGVT
jgi:RNA polymerase sigma-70 factor (ECF subfamily)